MKKNPYQDLYIYYIKGRINSENTLAGKSYIGNWEEDGFSFLFFTGPAHSKVENLLILQPELTILDKYHMKYDEWQGGEISPFKIGRFFFIPPWVTTRTHLEDLNIVMDPGVVFGNGAHPTTQDCLEALETVYCETAPTTVLDLGTGTGILALAAARLGSQKTVAVDFNFLAVKTAKRNVRLNHLDNRVMVVQGLAQDFMDQPADLVIANIHYDVMKDLLRLDGFATKKWFILSGLLRSQAKRVEHQLSLLPVTVLKTWKQEGIWHTFFGKTC